MGACCVSSKNPQNDDNIKPDREGDQKEGKVVDNLEKGLNKFKC